MAVIGSSGFRLKSHPTNVNCGPSDFKFPGWVVRDRVVRDWVVRDRVVRDWVVRDRVGRDGVVRDGVGRDGVGRDRVVWRQ